MLLSVDVASADAYRDGVWPVTRTEAADHRFHLVFDCVDGLVELLRDLRVRVSVRSELEDFTFARRQSCRRRVASVPSGLDLDTVGRAATHWAALLDLVDRIVGEPLTGDPVAFECGFARVHFFRDASGRSMGRVRIA
jgi:hypothetical protein